jgi:hypothetical protein
LAVAALLLSTKILLACHPNHTVCLQASSGCVGTTTHLFCVVLADSCNSCSVTMLTILTCKGSQTRSAINQKLPSCSMDLGVCKAALLATGCQAFCTGTIILLVVLTMRLNFFAVLLGVHICTYVVHGCRRWTTGMRCQGTCTQWGEGMRFCRCCGVCPDR